MGNISAKTSRDQGTGETIAVVGGTIIDANGGTPIDDGVIVIDGKRIQAVGDCSMPIPSHAKKICANGKFVIPGLMSPYQYLVEAVWQPEMIRCEGRYDEVAVEAAQFFLKGGVTSVFCTWGPRDPLIKARNAIDENRVTGARLYVGGSWVGCGGPYSLDLLHSNEGVGAPFAARTNAMWELNVGEELTHMPLDEARREVRRYAESGIDFVTYLVNTKRLGGMQFFAFSPRIQRMIVEEGHRAGLPVLGVYVNTEEGVHMALDAGVDMVVRRPWKRQTSTETLKLLAERGTPVLLSCVTRNEMECYRAHPNAYPGVLEYMEPAELEMQGLIRAGVPIVEAGQGKLYSADQVKAWGEWRPMGPLPPPDKGHTVGLRALQENGMTAMEALMTITRNAARAYKVDKDVGTLEPGKFADLVVLNKNPLESPDNYLDIHVVMKEGEVIDREALPSQRLWTKSSVEAN